jgi:hypothetical protein
MSMGGPNCQNCGRPSHCGVPLHEDFRNVWDRHLGIIEVCKYCRCKICSKVQSVDGKTN